MKTAIQFPLRRWILPVALLATFSASAQTLTVDWFRVAGGSGSSTGSVYQLSGTIGQHDASGPLTAASHSLIGGFWALYALPTTKGPALRIFLTSTNTAVVQWPSPSTGWKLQQTLNFAAGTWTTPSESVGDDGVEKFIIVKPPTGARFFRLNAQ